MEIYNVLLVLVLVTIIPVRGIEPNDTVSSLGGFELIAARLEHIQKKLIEIDLTMKEDREIIDQRLSHQETFSAGLLWAINQLSQTIGQNLTEDRAIIDQKLSGVSGAINRLSNVIGHNLTNLQAQSYEMIAQQRACASHEQMRNEIQMITSDVPRDATGEQMRKEIQMIPSDIPREQLKYSSDKPPISSNLTSGSYRSCKEVPSNRSGTYLIHPTVLDAPLMVYCEHNTIDGGGWLVFQSRYNGSVNFTCDWNSYRDGFGSVEGEFWLGLEKLHHLTSTRPHELLVEMKDYSGQFYYGRYTEFEIGDEINQYRLTKLNIELGTLDLLDMSYNIGSTFSTFDRDNDYSCAKKYKGGWWYYGCTFLSLNGVYLNKKDDKAMHWYKDGSYVLLSYSRMMIRER